MDYLPNKYVLGFATNTLVYNKARYTTTLGACGWAGAVLEKVTRASEQEPYAQKAKKRQKVKRGPTDQWTDQPTDQPGCRVA